MKSLKANWFLYGIVFVIFMAKMDPEFGMKGGKFVYENCRENYNEKMLRAIFIQRLRSFPLELQHSYICCVCD